MPLLYLVTKGKKSKTELKLCLFTPVEDKLSPVLNLLSTAETQVGALSGVYSPSSLFLLVVGPSNRRDMFGWCVCVCECVRVCVCVCVCVEGCFLVLAHQYRLIFLSLYWGKRGLPYFSGGLTAWGGVWFLCVQQKLGKEKCGVMIK